MTHPFDFAQGKDFENVRAAFAASVPARIYLMLVEPLSSAWRSSRFVSTARSVHGGIRPAGVAAAIAAAMQPLLIVMMPLTVRPAMPWWVFAVIAAFGAAAAWRPASFANAWQHSRLRQLVSLLRRLLGPDRPAANIG